MNLQQAKEFIGHRFKLGSEFVNAGKCQGSWEGIEGVVTDQLYPDPTHFVFELLQNAEDAGASQVNFSLTNAGLTYWHNGTRLFTSKDVEAITSIGQSQKRDDINQIGKFGVGFKSVFAFTLSPRISSGVFHFEITDLICPKWIETKNQKIDSFTYFYLPFNRPSKNQKECYDKISERLDNLPPSTLLFLRKIDRIKWDIAGRGEGFFEKKTIESGILQISQHNSKGISKTSYWLKFDAPSKEEPECVCSIAFKLKPTPPKISDTDSGIDNQRTRSSPNFVIVPLYEPGHLHIFFPAEKEPTGLYFLIHAPFAATVDRASIPFEHNGNNRLIAEIAELCSSKLHEIKKLGLLIPQFLEVLPNENDVIDEFYIPIRDAIVNEFKNSPLLPTHHGNYSKASDTVYGPVELRDFFIDEDLRFFMNDRSKVWSVGFPIPSRSDFFLNTLEIEEIDWRDFIKYLGSKFNKDIVSPQQLNASHLWIKTKMSDAENSVEWLSSFYSILLRADRDVRPYQFLAPDPNLRNSSVVWTNSGSFFNGEAVFFESSSVSVKGLNTLTIHPELISYKPKNTDKGKELRLALSMLGVKEFDEKRAVDALIFKISSQKISLDEHLEHIEYFLKWFENGKIDNFEKFRGVPFYRVENEKSYKSPDTCYIDAPIKATGLSIFPMGEVIIHKLWPGYVEKFDSEKFALFAEKTGVYSNIPVKKIRVPWDHPDRMDLLKFFTKRRTEYEISEDWQIDNLRDILAREDPKVNKVIWDGMGKVQKSVLTARFQPNGQHPLQSAHSSLVHVLRDANWILGKDGKLHRPIDITSSVLAEGWHINTSNGWLSAVKFGTSAEKLANEQLLRAEKAENLGIATELAEELATLSRDEQMKVLELIRKPSSSSAFPIEKSGVLQRRIDRAQELAGSTPLVEREERERSVRISSVKSEARVYLREKYSNHEGKLFCQMSHESMPFCLTSGEPYFETVQLFKLPTENRANYLCLSPTCAAEFRHALETSEEILKNRIKTLDINLPDEMLFIQLEVPITNHRKLRFQKSHLIDLQSIFKYSTNLSGASVESNVIIKGDERKTEPKSNSELVKCPHCKADVSSKNLEKHKLKKCPQLISSITSRRYNPVRKSSGNIKWCSSCNEIPAIFGSDRCRNCESW